MADSGIASALTADHFMTLLLAELKYQDPMEPMSNTEMVTQMAQIASLETSRGLDASFSEMFKLKEIQSGSSMLGRSVEFKGTQGTATGTVTAIRVVDEKIKLVIGGDEVGLSGILTVF
jgi:flagellar basal-body rod modification protein FlgD